MWAVSLHPGEEGIYIYSQLARGKCDQRNNLGTHPVTLITQETTASRKLSYQWVILHWTLAPHGAVQAQYLTVVTHVKCLYRDCK
jgi:hypothetical protein